MAERGGGVACRRRQEKSLMIAQTRAQKAPVTRRLHRALTGFHSTSGLAFSSASSHKLQGELAVTESGAAVKLESNFIPFPLLPLTRVPSTREVHA